MMARMFYILAFLLGMSCFIVQFVLIREFLNIFTGNELVIGIMLSLWMLITALGALLGRFISKKGVVRTIFSLIILIAVLPLAGNFLAVWLRAGLYDPGVMVSLPASMLITMAGLGGFCLVSGMLFSLVAGQFPGKEAGRKIAWIYAIEALGSLFGGILFYSFLIRIADPVIVLSYLMILNLFIAILFSGMYISRTLAIFTAIFGALAGAAVFSMDPGRHILEHLHPGEEIIHYSNNPHGRLLITKQGDEFNLYQGGSLLYNTGDLINREEKVHYAMSLHPGPEAVLMIGGGLDASFLEALKYGFPEMSFTYRCTEPWARKAAIEFTGLTWPYGIDIYDPGFSRNYLSPNTYDVILLNPPPPTTMGSSVYYSDSYFKAVRLALKTGGLICVQLPGAGNYLDQDSRMMFSAIYQSLQNSFEHIRVIPGEHVYYLASDQPLKGNITELIEEKGMTTDYVNRYYINDKLLNLRVEQFVDELDPHAPANKSFRPVAAYLSMQHWLGKFHTRAWLVAGIALIVMLLILLRFNSIDFGLFTAGFSSAAAEFVLIISFQIVYGSIYYSAGILIMVFMAGLFLGSGILGKLIHSRRNTYMFILYGLGASLLLIPLGLEFASFWLFIWIWPLMLLIAILSGILYKLASRLQEGSQNIIASRTYSADLTGSAFGAFLVAVFLFPLAGMTLTVLILAGINLLAAARLRLLA